jgi:iron complex outermembrane receptor protein
LKKKYLYRVLLNVFFILFLNNLHAQDSIVYKAQTVRDTVKIEEIVITGFSAGTTKNTSLNIEPVSIKEMETKNPANLSDALAKVPGISQITTGISISKPVIRGLYGNRILVLLSGLRFDNQQWQDEHGLGLSYIGIDRVELIKGPASVLYGTDALGGVINIIEEQPGKPGQKTVDVNTRFYSNTLGTLTDVGYKSTKEKKWFRVRAGIENHADYSDGRNQRVLNSRNNGYYLKLGKGFQRSSWSSENTYNFSLNNYGFIMEDTKDFFSPDARWSRSMAGPHHTVLFNILNSKNTFKKEKSLFHMNAGLQSNERMEDEGGGQISLNMHLFSALLNPKFEKFLSEKTTLIANTQLTFENNTNFGARTIVPDANMMEGMASVYLRQASKKLVMEAGTGLSNKFIQTFQTGNINTSGSTIQPFKINRSAVNGMLGFSYNPHRYVNLKANTASGFRAPNLAELSSNGLHEGVFRYEIGDPTMKIEQNINTDLTFEINHPEVFFYVSGFYNKFNNYIYLSPTGKDHYGFQIFQYLQQDAYLYGGEAVVKIRPKIFKSFSINGSYALTKGVLSKGGYLPFIPAQKITGSIRYEKKIAATSNFFYIEPQIEYVLRQSNPAQFETATPCYYLVNTSIGIEFRKNKNPISIYLTGRNILNRNYYDHLSRLKYYGIYNPGVNYMVTLKMPIDVSSKKK